MSHAPTMSVIAIRSADESYTKKLTAYRACQAAGVAIPVELTTFFDGDPEEHGPAFRLAYYDPEGRPDILHASAESFCHPEVGRFGILVDVRALPPASRFIRFTLQFDV